MEIKNFITEKKIQNFTVIYYGKVKLVTVKNNSFVNILPLFDYYNAKLARPALLEKDNGADITFDKWKFMNFDLYKNICKNICIQDNIDNNVNGKNKHYIDNESNERIKMIIKCDAYNHISGLYIHPFFLPFIFDWILCKFINKFNDIVL